MSFGGCRATVFAFLFCVVMWLCIAVAAVVLLSFAWGQS